MNTDRQSMPDGSMTSIPILLKPGMNEVPDNLWLSVGSRMHGVDIPGIGVDVLLPDGKIVGPEIFSNIFKGMSGKYFPFVFSSRYFRLAGLKNIDPNSSSWAEQVLFRVLEAGALVGLGGWPVRDDLSSVPLPKGLREKCELAEYFFYGFSAELPGVSKHRRPDRFSYKSLFWKTDDNTTIHKLYRYPDVQPRYSGDEPMFAQMGPSVVGFRGCREILTPTGTHHALLSMDNLEGWTNGSDWAQIHPESAPWLARIFLKAWMEFLSLGVVPLDISLSNSMVLEHGHARLVDVEETIGLDDYCRGIKRRPVLCLLAVIMYLLDGDRLREMRFDLFRDLRFIPGWTGDGEIYPRSRRLAELFREIFQCDDPNRMKIISQELMDHVDESV